MIIEEELDKSVERNMIFFAEDSFYNRYPDIRDGLKPVARRVVYAMEQAGLSIQGGTIKCATIVGNVIGHYHPHGDVSAYQTLVGLAEPFGMNQPIVYFQGNVGSISGDPAAAYRYTECKFAKYAACLITGLSEEIVEYCPTFDEKRREPTVLPAMVPNLLINGNYTIAGAAFNSSIPSHNLGEIVDLTIKVITNPDISNKELGKNLMPDFPSGGVIVNPHEIREYYMNGTPCAIKMIADYEIDKNTRTIYIKSLPFMVTSEAVKNQITEKYPKLSDIGIEQICDCTKDSTVDLRIIYNKNTNPEKLIGLLLKKTKLQGTSQLSFTCTHGLKLMVEVELKSMFVEWIKFRRKTVRREIMQKVQKNYSEVHILDALVASYGYIDEVFANIKMCNSKDEAVTMLQQRYGFSVLQATAIAAMHFYDVTKNSIEDLIAKRDNLNKEMIELRLKLNDKAIDAIIIEQLQDIKQKFNVPRKTKVLEDYGAANENTAKPVDVVVSRNTDGSLSFMRTNSLPHAHPQTKIFSATRSNNSEQLVKYNTVTDYLFGVTNFGIMYPIEDITEIINKSTVESLKWEEIPMKLSPRLDEVLVHLVVLPRKEFDERVGDIIVSTTDNYCKRVKLSSFPVKGINRGVKIMSDKDSMRQVSLVSYIPVNNEQIAYVTEHGHIHVYLKDFLPETERRASMVKMSPSQLRIVNVVGVNKEDFVYGVARDGVFESFQVTKIPMKKFNVLPHKLFNVKASKKGAHLISSFGKIDGSLILMAAKDGSFTLNPIQEIVNIPSYVSSAIIL